MAVHSDFEAQPTILMASAAKKEKLPRPSGMLTVGFLDYEWELKPTERVPELPGRYGMARIYYPSALDPETAYEQRSIWAVSKDEFLNMKYPTKIPKCIFRILYNRRIKHLHAWAVENAPLAPIEGKLPLIIFSHGMASQRNTYSALICDLTSHGYMVAVLAHHDNSASCVREDGVRKPYQHVKDLRDWNLEKRPTRVQELSLVIDFLEDLNAGCASKNIWVSEAATEYYPADDLDFTEKIDFSKLTEMGHSYGGAASLATGGLDSRVKLVVALDPWVLALPQNITPLPTLIITSGSTFQKDSDIVRLKEIAAAAPSSLMISINGSGHIDQCDMPFLHPGLISFKSLAYMMPKQARDTLDFAESKDLELTLRINRELILAFLEGKLDLETYDPLQDWAKFQREQPEKDLRSMSSNQLPIDPASSPSNLPILKGLGLSAEFIFLLFIIALHNLQRSRDKLKSIAAAVATKLLPEVVREGANSALSAGMGRVKVYLGDEGRRKRSSLASSLYRVISFLDQGPAEATSTGAVRPVSRTSSLTLLEPAAMFDLD